jgi:two-component system cell cycle sensor histidine kinase/response regulator CckA
VLVIDDDESVRMFAERALRDGGYQVITASNGAAALEIVAEHRRPFDLFVIDLMMPAMTGDALAASLRRALPDIRVLYFTGFGDELFKEKGMLWAQEAYLEKPVSVQGLREAASLLLFGHTQGPSHHS